LELLLTTIRPHGLEGKLSYLGSNSLGGLRVFHQGSVDGDNIGGMNVSASGVTSVGAGTTVTAQFIENEIAAGEDVELGYLYEGGSGHFVDVVGAGTILGDPWITYVSDHDQGVDTGPLSGTQFVDFSFLADSDGDGVLNLVDEKGMPNVVFVVTQSASVPEPATTLLLAPALFLAALRRCLQVSR